MGGQIIVPPSTPPLYTGLIATRAHAPSNFASSATTAMYRSVHFARDTITSLQCVWANWYMNLPNETATGAPATLTASIEYPAGTFTQVKFSGSASGVAASGANITSDPVLVAIPRAAKFWVRMFWTCAAGVLSIFPGGTPAVQGEGVIFNTTDQTMSGTFVNANPGFYLPPLAIIGPTRRPTIFLAGDSVQFGANEVTSNRSADATGAMGITERSLIGSFACFNAGLPSEKLQQAIANYSKRLTAAQYCSHIVSSHGINDYFNGRTGAQVAADRTTFAALFGGKPVIGTTLPPSTTSNNLWADAAGQLVKPTEGERVNFNTLERAGIDGETGYIDIGDFFEIGRNLGIWITNGTANAITRDGVHPELLSSTMLQQSGLIQPGLFWR